MHRFDGLDSVVIIKLVLCDADIISTDMDNNIRLIAVLVVLRNALAGDNLALLSGTLKTYQKTACDFDKIQLTCPRGTSITIELAQYKKPSPDSKEYTICPLQRLNRSNEFEDGPYNICQVTDNHKYSLLQTAIETCQKKTMCQFVAAPKSPEGKPCPNVRRLIYFAYKCRPYEFRSKVACENEIIQLTCSPYWRITIYSASYGRTEYESVQCAQPQGVLEETCLASYANERVMQICHGKRRCIISADTATFGNPCKPESRMYLKIVYTCVPRQILKDMYDDSTEPDEPIINSSTETNEIFHEDQFFRESEAIPPAPKVHGGLANVKLFNASIGQGVQYNQASFDDQASEDASGLFSVYIVLTAIVLVLMILIVFVIGRIVFIKRRSSVDTKTHDCSDDLTMEVKERRTDDVISMDSDLNSVDHVTISNMKRDEKLFGSTYVPSSYANLDPDNISFTLLPTTSMHPCPTPASDFTNNLCLTSTFQSGPHPVQLNRQFVATIVPNHSPYLYNDQSINLKQNPTNFHEFYPG